MKAPTLDDIESWYIGLILAATGNNRARAARFLGVDRRTLYRWLEFDSATMAPKPFLVLAPVQ